MNLSDNQLQLLVKYLSIEERQPNHMWAIEEALTKLEFFRKLRAKNHLKPLQQCWKHLSYLKLNKGQTVFYKGEWPKDFYIILEGEVSILIPKDQKVLNADKEANKALSKEIQSQISSAEGGRQRQIVDKRLHKMILIKQQSGHIQLPDNSSSVDVSLDDVKIKMHSTPAHQPRKSEAKVLPVKPLQQGIMRNQIEEVGQLTIGDLEEPEMYFDGGTFKYKQIHTQQRGTQFGETELVLLQGRSATVLCLQDCHFAILSKEHFDKILLEIIHAKIMKKAQGIQKSLGLNLPYNLMIQISNCFHKVVQYLGAYLLVEGDEATDIIVVKKGEVQLLKALKNVGDNQVEMMKSPNLQDHFVRLAIYGPDIMMGHQDVMSNQPRSYTIQVTSAKVNLYLTDKYQFKAAMADITGAQKIQMRRMIDDFQDGMKVKLLNYQKIIDLAAANDLKNSQNKVQLARTSVEVINTYLDQRVDAYGSDKMDKLQLMQELLDSFPVRQELDNDEFIQAFDKAGIEKKLKKLRLRRKILTRGNISKSDEEKFNNMLRLRVPSTRDKIKLQKSIESGEYRMKQTSSKNKKNLPWELIYTHQQQDKSRHQWKSQASLTIKNDAPIDVDYIDESFINTSKLKSFPKAPVVTPFPHHVSLQDTFMLGQKLKPRRTQTPKDLQSRSRPQTSISRKFTSPLDTNYTISGLKTNKEISFFQQDNRSAKMLRATINPIILADLQFNAIPVFDFNRKEQKSDQKFQFIYKSEVSSPVKQRPATGSCRGLMQSIHNLYRFGSPQNAQVNLLKKRFDNKK